MSSYRFDPEKATAACRGQFVHSRAFTGEDADELECSPDDRVEALAGVGLSEETAFREALRRQARPRDR